MNKIYKNLLFVNLVIILAFFLVLGFVLNILPAEFIPFLSAGILLAVTLAWVIRRLYFKPIQQIQRVARKISEGDFKSRLPLARKDELGELATSLNQMSVELQDKVKEIMRDKNELEAILSSMVEGVIVVGKDERIILMNSPVHRMLDLRSRDTIGKPYWEVIRHEEINHLFKEAIQQKQSLKREISLITPLESQFSVQVSPVLIERGELSAVVAVFHDVTEFNKLARMRSEFVANVSHELKTPLTSIKGFVETLKEGAINDEEKAIKFLEIIQRPDRPTKPPYPDFKDRQLEKAVDYLRDQIKTAGREPGKKAG